MWVQTVRVVWLESEAGERSRNGQKLKLERQQEFVIGGYRPAGDTSVHALLVGCFENKELRFAAKVRAGGGYGRQDTRT